MKNNFEKIEGSQAQERSINEHISAFRGNEKLFVNAKGDVETLEELLEALQENLEKSQVKNVLQRIQSLHSISDIAKAIFGVKPTEDNAWRIIIGVVIFVGFLTLVHFMIWGRRSRALKLEQAKKAQEAAQAKQG